MSPRVAFVLLLSACDAPDCPEGEAFDIEGLCVPVVPAPDTGAGDTDDSGSLETGDSADTADTGEPWGELPRRVDTLAEFDTTAWLGEGVAWYGMSVAPDGSVWAASGAGLLHLSADGSSHRVYTTADGLFANDARAVLAARDGTVWVGYSGTVDRQGDQFSVGSGGELSPLRVVDYTESVEITGVYRLREQPFGVGAGDIWMGTNEGLCLWDADLDVFAEHAHPTHPHLLARGVAFTPEADVWGGDQYQLARWRYSNDGDLSPSADLYEYWVPWPVEVGAPVDIEDADAAGSVLWVVSSVHGLARVDVAEAGGASVTSFLPELGPARAVRQVDARSVLVGTDMGLGSVDLTLGTVGMLGGAEGLTGQVQQIARVEPEGDGSAWLALPGKLVRLTLTPAR